MAATLGTSGLVLVAARSAARLHRLDGFVDTDVVEVVFPYGGHDHTNDDVIAHWSRRISAKDRHVVGNIPVTILPVTLIQLEAGGFAAAQALDSALRQRKPPQWLRQHFHRWIEIGSHEADTMMTALDERMGKRLPRSWFQRLAAELLSQDGIHMVDEWPIRDGNGNLLAELDLADVELKVGVECQSIEYHESVADRARDIRRRRMLRRLGWDIVDLWWSDLDRMADVVVDVREALDRARRLLA